MDVWIDRYNIHISIVLICLFIVDQVSHLCHLTLQDWLVDRRKAIGRTALCLSGGGSLAMHHMGVCRFLLEARRCGAVAC